MYRNKFEINDCTLKTLKFEKAFENFAYLL